MSRAAPMLVANARRRLRQAELASNQPPGLVNASPARWLPATVDVPDFQWVPYDGSEVARRALRYLTFGRCAELQPRKAHDTLDPCDKLLQTLNTVRREKPRSWHAPPRERKPLIRPSVERRYVASTRRKATTWAQDLEAYRRSLIERLDAENGTHVADRLPPTVASGPYHFAPPPTVASGPYHFAPLTKADYQRFGCLH